MQCPKCKVKMQTMKKAALAIDECSRCGGIWFDQGELNQMIGATDPDLRWLDIDFWRDNSSFSVSSGRTALPQMQPLLFNPADRQGRRTQQPACAATAKVSGWISINCTALLRLSLKLQIGLTVPTT